MNEVTFEEKAVKGPSSRGYIGIRCVAETLVNGVSIKLLTEWEYLDPTDLGELAYKKEEALKEKHLGLINGHVTALHSLGDPTSQQDPSLFPLPPHPWPSIL